MFPLPSRLLLLSCALISAPCCALAQDLETPALPPETGSLPEPVTGDVGATAALAPDATSVPAVYIEPVSQDPMLPADEAPIAEAPATPEEPVRQQLQAPAVTAPSGFTNPVSPFASSALGSGLEDVARRFHLGLSSALTYDSNFFQTSSNEDDEVTFVISPTFSFQTQGAAFQFIGQAALNYNTYFENSDNNGLGYNLSLEGNYDGGGPLSAHASISSSKEQGVNRYYGSAFVETMNFNTSLGASYRISQKTSIDGRFGYSWTDPDEAGLSQTENTSFDLSAMWQATPLLRIGPGVSWSLAEGSNQDDRETIGPILRAQYKLSNRIALDGTVGLDFADYGGGGDSDTDFNCSLGVAYRWSELWGMSLRLYHGTSADGSRLGTATGSFRETTSIGLGYHRQVMRALWDVSLNYSMDDSSNPNGLLAPGDSDYFTFRTSLGMPIFANRANASVFYSWMDESGGLRGDWNGHQVGFQISTGF
ncbi:hypothetical protein [Luteolibacter luteus]|uniref:Beta-barrel porin 2 n=1 Tax=Luteolibacter luteus TaxID=2728835 RepID=A0A858RCA1_9BACT|nr:hypothetical protein [Luteolibacter luteus]QJE94271.1 hypothetical protein HHL09_00210 [Luteolibacter luteus]